ncbi:MAG: HDOD domain-containing protein [Deltaproteobacteria bacterium]|nr:HDOD domain-containing protein [Deltaproteobacteria bacterium]
MIDRIVRSIENIPAFPATIQKVTELLSRDDYAVSEVAGVIKYDQSITANILRMSNSAYFGVRYKIRTIQDAVTYLGRQNLIRAVQTAGISRFFAGTPKGYVSRAAELWKHSVAVALMSQILSRKIFNREDAILYTASLLHDVGKVILGEYVQESFRIIEEMVTKEGHSFLEAEEKVIGINHADLGGKIAVHWNFPPEIKNPIAFHHNPNRLDKADQTSSWLVYLADQACLMMGIGGGTDGLAYRGLGEAGKMFNLKTRDIEGAMILLTEDLERARDLTDIIQS